MLKRSYGVYWFICAVLGCNVGYWISLAVSQSSIYYGVWAILTAIASVLHIICGPDKKSNSNKGKE